MERACLTAVITVDGFTTNIFRYIDAADLDDAGKVELEMGELTVNGGELHITENSTITLPVVGNLFNNVTISWASNNECAVVNGSKLVITLPKEATTIILTATITSGSVSETVEFELAIDAATADLFVGKFLSDVKAGTAYKFGFVQGTLGKTLYLTGVVSGRYLETTEKAELAADVYVEAVENGNKIYILDGETKKYLDVYFNADSKLSLQFNAEGACVFAYNATVNAWVTNVDGTDYYVGTYSNFATMSASKLSYISAENTGVSQFPGNFFVQEVKEVGPVAKSEPVEGVAYKFSLVQGTLGQTLYLTGVVSGRYLETTDKISKAVDVFVEKVDGGYKIYILDGEAKKYLDVYFNADSKLSLQFNAEGACVFAYNATVNAWVTNVDGTDYYVGTYSNFATMSASKLSYISAENTGVSQFPANIVAIEFVEEAPACEHEWSDATCEAPKTCSKCGATEGDVADHTYVEGVCSVCGAKDPNYVAPGEKVFGIIDAPVAGTAYKFGMVQEKKNDGKVYYLTGAMSGYYMATTTDETAALDVYLEETTDGYYLYAMINGAKTYINMVVSGTHVNGAYEAAASTVYRYDAESKTVIAVVNNTDYWFGTRNDNTYTTVGPCAVSYKGFYCKFYGWIEGETPVECEHTGGTATCKELAICANCGEAYGELADHAWGEALSHDAVNHWVECSVCGEKKNEAAHDFANGDCACGEPKPVCNHVWSDVTCTEGSVCTICGEEGEAALGHDWADATCTDPKTCLVCKATEGEALGHDWADATCTTPKTCKNGCGLTEGEALGHNDENADYKCDVCSTVMAPEADSYLTVEQALALAKCYAHNTYTANKYFVTGIVTNVYNTTYGNMYIKDENGKQLCIYGLYTWDKETRYDKMTYKPVEGDELSVYGIIGQYNSTLQMKDAWMDDVVAHEHDWSDATCTAPKTCSICKATEGEALGHEGGTATCTAKAVCVNCGEAYGSLADHNFVDGTCSACGEAESTGGEVEPVVNYADFSKFTKKTTYTTHTTSDKLWTATNSQIVEGGSTNNSSSGTFIVLGDSKAVILNGKTSAKGSLTSATLTGGISKLSFSYTNVFSEKNGVDVTINIKVGGTVVATTRLDNNSVTQYTEYTYEWVLDSAVTGDFVIEIVNNSPSNNTGNKDRVAIWNLSWTSAN